MRNFLLIIILTIICANIQAQGSAEDYYKLGLISQNIDESIKNFNKAIDLKPEFINWTLGMYITFIKILNETLS